MHTCNAYVVNMYMCMLPPAGQTYPKEVVEGMIVVEYRTHNPTQF